VGGSVNSCEEVKNKESKFWCRRCQNLSGEEGRILSAQKACRQKGQRKRDVKTNLTPTRGRESKAEDTRKRARGRNRTIGYEGRENG